jgi:transcriptional regulator with XRE-family HTH domain
VNIHNAIKTARQQSGLTMHELARLANTSHSALAAYESGSKVPKIETLERIVSAAGFAIDIHLEKRMRHHSSSTGTRGEELEQVLELAQQFPARPSRNLNAPIFGRTP